MAAFFFSKKSNKASIASCLHPDSGNKRRALKRIRTEKILVPSPSTDTRRPVIQGTNEFLEAGSSLRVQGVMYI